MPVVKAMHRPVVVRDDVVERDAVFLPQPCDELRRAGQCGALAGGFTVAHASPGVVGWVGGSFEVLGLVLVLVIGRRQQARGLVVA